MESYLRKNSKLFWRTVLSMAALCGFLLLAGTPQAFADMDDYCQRRIAKADHRLHEAVEHHGWNSRQVESARHNLHEAREECWNRFHKWWDEHDHRWHTEHDWDDHDHDHDLGHDH